MTDIKAIRGRVRTVSRGKGMGRLKLHTRRLFQRIVVYAILIGLGYVFIYPILYMLSLSFMSREDLINPTVQWVPNAFTLSNFRQAFAVLHLPESLFISLFISTVSALLQTFTCAVTAYGLERFSVPGRKILLVLVALTFIIPSQVTLVPRHLMFHTYGMKNTLLPAFLPAFFGQGLKSAVFILIFYQFFHSCPRALDEAAQIDGAGRFRVFWRIALPMCTSGVVVTFLFSFVWYWNETYQSSIYYGEVIKTLPMRLQGFANEFSRVYPTTSSSDTNRINESIRMAGTLLTILPLLVLYAFLQRQFVESIEKTGITGE